MALPKIVYIYEDAANDGSKFLVASQMPDEQNEGIVGVYELRETLHVRHQPQFRRPKTKTWFSKG